MLTITIRPYLVAEKKAISDESITGVKPYAVRSIFTADKKSLLSVLVPVFLLIVLYFIIKNFFEISGSAEVVLLIILALAGFLFIARKYIRYPESKKEKIDIDLDHAEVIHVTTTRAIKKENPFGPGMGFYIDVFVGNERKTLYLYGQQLEEMDHDRKFPNTEFEIVRSLKTKQVINFLVLGNYFAAEKSLPAFSRDELQNELMLQDIRILDVAIDEIK